MASSRLRNCRSLPNERIGKCSNTCGGGYCDNPGPNDPPRHAPLHGGDAAGGADAHDRARNRVRRTNGNPTPRRANDADGSSRFRAEPADRSQCRDFLSHRTNDFPTAGQRTETDRSVSHEHHPEWNIEGFEIPPCEQNSGNDAHGFLRVIGAMAEAEQRSREQLQAPKILIYA